MKADVKKIFTTMMFALFLGLCFSGCAAEKSAKKDPFFEKWDIMAKQSEGHSPTSSSKPIDMQELTKMAAVQEPADTKMQADRRLPTNPVDLKMRQADIKAVLRSLARAAGRNILIKNDIKADVTVDFKGVPWDQVFTGLLRTYGLTYTWEGDLIRIMTPDDLEQDLKRKTQEINVKWVEPLSTVIVNIDYADSKSLRDNLQEFLTKDKDGKTRGSVRVDEHTNALIIQAIRDDIQKMLPLIAQIDKPTYQIKIKAHIVETTKDTARNLGIQWGGLYKTTAGSRDFYLTPGGYGAGDAGTTPGEYKSLYGSPGIARQGFAVNLPAAMSTAASGSIGLMFGTLGGNILEMQLNALQSDGKVNILSSPSITTLDNQKAFTESGKKVPVANRDKDGNITIRYEDAVLRLEIKPHVIDGKNLKMNILVKKDEVDPNTLNYIEGNPPIYKKQTETSLIVQDGETIVISGLSIEQRSNSEVGIPLFKNVPVLGWLFKKEDKSNAMEEVLIFITPSILPPRGSTPVSMTTADPVKPEAEGKMDSASKGVQ